MTATPNRPSDPSSLLASEQAARADSDAAAAVLRRMDAIHELAFADLPLQPLALALLERMAQAVDADAGMLAVIGTPPFTAVYVADGARVIESDSAPIGRVLSILELGRPDAGTASNGEGLAPHVVAKVGEQYSYASVQVATAERTYGAIEVYRTTERPFLRDDVGVLQLAADRVAMVFDRARVVESERRARADAEQARDLVGRLQRITAALPGLTEDTAIGELLLQETVPHLGASSGAVYARSELRPSLTRVAAFGKTEGPWPHANPQELGLLDDGAAAIAVREVRLVDADHPPERERGIRESGDARRVAVPLVRADGRPAGALVLGFEHAATDLDIRWLNSVALQGAQAFERARLARERARMYEEERKGRAQAEERARAARVLERVGEGVFLVDLGGVVRSWNAAASAITGVPPTAALGSRLDAVLPEFAELRHAVPVDVDPRSPSSRETIPVDVDGREQWWSVSGATTEDGIVYAIRDVTEGRVVERMRDELVATVSHELRTPLAGMMGSIETLLRDDIQLADATKIQLLDMLSGQARRLAKIVEDMLQANRLESDNERIINSQFDAGKLVERHLDYREGVQLVRRDDDLLVEADSERFVQILDNLLDNAIAYGASDEPIEVSVARADDEDGMVRLVVRDHGAGIPPSEHGRVFERFYRLDPDMRRDSGGNGLGLYICRRLAEKMGARIFIDADVTDGAAFVLELPSVVTPG